jgi:hypothetical protein
VELALSWPDRLGINANGQGRTGSRSCRTAPLIRALGLIVNRLARPQTNRPRMAGPEVLVGLFRSRDAALAAGDAQADQTNAQQGDRNRFRHTLQVASQVGGTRDTPLTRLPGANIVRIEDTVVA